MANASNNNTQGCLGIAADDNDDTRGCLGISADDYYKCAVCSLQYRKENKVFYRLSFIVESLGFSHMVMATSLYLCIYASLIKRLCVSKL